jgi:exodeoxyribonuclease VII large subunit
MCRPRAKLRVQGGHIGPPLLFYIFTAMSIQSFSVSELNKFIRDVLTSGFPNVIWVCGEIQGYRTDQKGHAYFELVENEEDSHAVKAKIRASIWNTRRPMIDAVLRRVENAFKLQDNIQVRFLCKVDFWAKAGSLSLVVENIDPAYTLGKIAQERQKLIALLKMAGVLDKNKELTMPVVPLQIGLITSLDSAAYNDFINELSLSQFGFKVSLVNSTMQGKGTESSVSAAIRKLNTMAGLDVIVITRGGGSIAELACFDSEPIARAIAESKIPVLTGIGHEINSTVTDLAAHSYAKTPTAAAQILIGRVRDYLTGIEEKKKALLDLVNNKLQHEEDALRQRAHVFQSGTMRYLRDHREHVLRACESIKRLPVVLIKDASRGIKDRRINLAKTIQLNLNNARIKIKHSEKVIQLASPVQTLKRGFSITRGADGKALRSARQIKKGAKITTELLEGTLNSEIT